MTSATQPLDPFLAAILDDPADDGPRLVYADYLEERGEVLAAAKLRAPGHWRVDFLQAVGLWALYWQDQQSLSSYVLPWCYRELLDHDAIPGCQACEGDQNEIGMHYYRPVAFAFGHWLCQPRLTEAASAWGFLTSNNYPLRGDLEPRWAVGMAVVALEQGCIRPALDGEQPMGRVYRISQDGTADVQVELLSGVWRIERFRLPDQQVAGSGNARPQWTAQTMNQREIEAICNYASRRGIAQIDEAMVAYRASLTRDIPDED